VSCRIDEIIRLFCRRALQKRRYSVKETLIWSTLARSCCCATSLRCAGLQSGHDPQTRRNTLKRCKSHIAYEMRYIWKVTWNGYNQWLFCGKRPATYHNQWLFCGKRPANVIHMKGNTECNTRANTLKRCKSHIAPKIRLYGSSFMYIHIAISTYTHLHTYINGNVHTYIHICTCVNIHMNVPYMKNTFRTWSSEATPSVETRRQPPL